MSADATSTSCFTKSYSKYFKGTGSVLLVDASPALEAAYAKQRGAEPPATPRTFDANWAVTEFGIVRSEAGEGNSHSGGGYGSHSPKLRYFTPSERLRLFGFHGGFEIPLAEPQNSKAAADASTANTHKKDKKDKKPSMLPSKGVSIHKAFEMIGNTVNVTVCTQLLLFLLNEALAQGLFQAGEAPGKLEAVDRSIDLHNA